MVQHVHGKDKVGLLRGLAATKGYEAVKLPPRNAWLLVDQRTGTPATTNLGATGFSVDKAIAYLKKRPDRA